MYSPIARAVCALVLSLASFQFASAQLRQIYLSDENHNHVRSFSFYSPREGYVAFWNWVGYTTDSGRTFVRKYITPANIDRNGYPEWNGNPFWIHGVKAFSRDTILVYGQYEDHASVLYSTNGGNNFKLIFFSWSSAYIKNYITEISFARNSNVGYAVDNDRILKTNNRGLTWSPAGAEAEAEFFGVQAISNNEVIAISPKNIYRTTNGTGPFAKLPIPAGWVRHCYFLTGNKGWASINDDIYYTSDGGESWIRKNKVRHIITRLHFINDSTGFGITDDYTVLKTTDSGKVWEPVIRDNQFNASRGLTQLSFWNDNQFWVGGDGGLIELSTNGGGIPLPRAHFRIDTTGVHSTNTVNLHSDSKDSHLHKWYRNDTLLGTGNTASYAHYLYDAVDTVKLVVTNGVFSDSLIQFQRFNAPPRPLIPSVTGFTPGTGPSGTIVTITGINFTGATAVSFGGVPAGSFTVVSANMIRAVVGAGASGDVKVTTPIGVGVKPGYTWFIPFAIRSFFPASGVVGSQVTIRGNHFDPVAGNNIVYFGAVKAAVVTASDTQLVVTVPLGTTYAPISVTTNGLTAFSQHPFLLTFEGGGPITKNSFPFKVNFDADTHAYQLRTDDLDGDGKPDLVMSNFERVPNAVMISRNTSTVNNVSFAPIQYLLNGPIPALEFGVMTGDVNVDGRKDIFTSDGGSGFAVFINTSIPGNISYGPRTIFEGRHGVPVSPYGLIDFDGDGKPDLFGVASSRVCVYKNNTSGKDIQFTLVTTKMYTTDFGDCAAIDFDGDGKPDIVSHGARSLYVYRNTSNGGDISFTQVLELEFANVHTFSRLAVGDLDNDGKPDLAARKEDGGVTVFRNTSAPGQFGFAPGITFSNLTRAYNIAFADMNGDGKVDIVSASSNGSFYGKEDEQAVILENRSTAGNIDFAPEVSVAFEAENHNTAWHVLVDIDGDGRNDIVTQNVGVDFSVFLNQQGISQVKVCDMGSTTLNSPTAGSTYQWQRNVAGNFVNISDNANFTGTSARELQLKNIPASWNGYQYRCLVNGNPGQVFRVAVDTFSRPEVTISTANLAVCESSPVTFTALTANAGKTPHYEWQLNGVTVGSDTSKLVISTLKDKDQVQVIITGSLLCHAPLKDTSNLLTMNVHNITVTPKVTIEASDTVICAGERVTFRAITENAGEDPQFYWRYLIINAPNAMDSSIYTTPGMNASGPFHVIMVSNAACASPVEVTSNWINITVKGRDFPGIEIDASAEKICTGTPVTFTATTKLAGPDPQYLWKRNSAEVGTASTYTASNFANGDKITAYMVSSHDCISTPYAHSNTVAMEVSDPVTPTITITGNNIVGQGQSTSLTASFTHGGSAPALQWQDSTAMHGWANVAGATATTIVYTPATTGVKVRCVLTSNAACASATVTNSAALMINVPTSVNPVPADNYGIRFSPNPVSSFFNIDKLRLADQWESLEIVSAEGRQRVMSRSIRNQTRLKVSVHNLRNGFYAAVLRKKNGEAVYIKFVKL